MAGFLGFKHRLFKRVYYANFDFHNSITHGYSWYYGLNTNDPSLRKSNHEECETTVWVIPGPNIYSRYEIDKHMHAQGTGISVGLIIALNRAVNYFEFED